MYILYHMCRHNNSLKICCMPWGLSYERKYSQFVYKVPQHWHWTIRTKDHQNLIPQCVCQLFWRLNIRLFTFLQFSPIKPLIWSVTSSENLFTASFYNSGFEIDSSTQYTGWFSPNLISCWYKMLSHIGTVWNSLLFLYRLSILVMRIFNTSFLKS